MEPIGSHGVICALGYLPGPSGTHQIRRCDVCFGASALPGPHSGHESDAGRRGSSVTPPGSVV